MLYTTSGPSPYWVIEIIKTESVKSKIHHNGNKATKKFFCIRIISENLMPGSTIHTEQEPAAEVLRPALEINPRPSPTVRTPC